MKFIPLFKVSNVPAALKHYTEVLDFVMTCPDDTPDSPVIDLGHDPIDQSWGRREFYVTDPDGNTLRFTQPLT